MKPSRFNPQIPLRPSRFNPRVPRGITDAAVMGAAFFMFGMCTEARSYIGFLWLAERLETLVPPDGALGGFIAGLFFVAYFWIVGGILHLITMPIRRFWKRLSDEAIDDAPQSQADTPNANDSDAHP